jgi:nucleotide-binding universal stress UspA family protein
MSASMKRYGIVVGVDGSDASNAAVLWAARDATMRHVPLMLVHMANPAAPMYPVVPMSIGWSVWHEENGRQLLEHAIKLAEDVVETEDRFSIAREFIWASPVASLVELSDNAEMVVVGSHGRAALARGLLGSVSSGAVRQANCPVAVIHEQDPSLPQPSCPDQAAVVVGIDGSPASELATAIAFDEASRRNVDLRVVHAWSDIEVVELPGFFWSEFENEAQRILAERLAGWQERYPDVAVQRLVIADRPARRLIKEARSAQLVVVGSHGRGRVTGMLLGSVSNAIVHSTHTPVIVARPSKKS